MNGEVRALKQGPRSVANDFRLRQRMADAEALGRRLTEAEAAQRLRAGGASVASPSPAPSPQALPTDGPAELQAKADILLDQAQKLTAEADRLDRQVVRDKTRATLRARARHLEQDPFIGFEASRRSIVFSRSQSTRDEASRGAPEPGEGQPGVSDDDGNTSAEAAPPPALETSSEGAGAPVASPPPSASSPPAGAPPASSPPSGAPPASTPPDVASGGGVTLSSRAFLDAGTLAEVERLRASGDPKARDKAAAALSEALRKQAQALRARAEALRAGP